MLLRESLIFTVVVYLRLVSARLEYLDLKPRCYFETISCPCERYGTPEKSVNVTLKVCNRLNLNEHKKSVCSGKAIVEKCRGGKLITFSSLQSKIPRSSSFWCSKILRFSRFGRWTKVALYSVVAPNIFQLWIVNITLFKSCLWL